jgi:hypothetical protein
LRVISIIVKLMLYRVCLKNVNKSSLLYFGTSQKYRYRYWHEYKYLYKYRYLYKLCDSKILKCIVRDKYMCCTSTGTKNARVVIYQEPIVVGIACNLGHRENKRKNEKNLVPTLTCARYRTGTTGSGEFLLPCTCTV